MNFAFEAATISITIGVIVAVLLQGRPLDRTDAVNVPPRLAFVIRVADMWLAVVFILVVFLTIGVAFDAIARRQPMQLGDRRVVEHLLMVAASYPALIAIVRRMLPVLFSAPPDEAPYALPQLEWPVLLVPVLGLVGVIFLLDGLVDPSVPFDAAVWRIATVGAVLVSPCAAVPFLSTWRSRRLMRRARRCAGDEGLVEQAVTCSLPDGFGDIAVRAFVGSIDGCHACWLDVNETKRLVRCLTDARRTIRARGIEPASPQRWFWSGGPCPRLMVRYDGRLGRSDEGWACLKGKPFVDGAGLLSALGARIPLSAR
jgi:hypothetical protein